MSLRYLLKPIDVAQERNFEREAVARKAERYLQTNPLDRVKSDLAYALKVQHIREGLVLSEGERVKGWILDLGGNTAGEATVLAQEGFNFIVGDVNEVALDISQQRARKYGLRSPVYVALDAQELPFADNSFSAVSVIEALHHFPDYKRVLAEIWRVLKPGGIFYSHEPNGLNPLRRLSEIRDRMRGTIEKSFYVSQLRRLCREARFQELRIQAIPFGTSSWKAREVPLYRRPVTYVHGFLQAKVPRFFGPIDIRARKPGDLADSPPDAARWNDLLRSPISRLRVMRDHQSARWVEVSGAWFYPEYEGIPVLIRGDARTGSGLSPEQTHQESHDEQHKTQPGHE
jgi:ubiquinone/menaquinone biosynthesis C-methylase UbiE